MVTISPEAFEHLLPALATASIQETPPAPGPDAATPEGVASPSIPWLPVVLILVVFYFLLIAPERKQRKKREALLAALQKGDRVMTTGGLYASVAAIQDDVVTLQVADGVRMRFSRQAIQTVLQDEGSDDKPAG